MHRSQIFFYILLVFILGVFAGSFFDISKNAALVVAAVCAAIIALFYRHGSRLLNPRLSLLAFLTLFFVAGFLRFDSVHSRTHILQKFAEAQENVVDPQNKHPIEATLYGYVDEEPEPRGQNQQLIFRAKELSAPPYLLKTDERVLIATQPYPEYRYGQTLKINGNLRQTDNFSEDFDYRAYLAKSNIYTTMGFPDITDKTRNGEKLELKLSFWEKMKITIFKKIFAVKKSFESSLGRSISEPNAAFVGGILLGSRSQIPQDMKDAFAKTSMTHVLAISGYNITIIAWIVSAVFLLFFRRQTAFWFSVLGIFIFVILTGAQASVIRAAVMGILVLLAHREGRLNDSRNAIVLAGAAMILINPLILRYDIGFQLSFMATLGLIYLAPAIEKYLAKLPDTYKLRETFTMTLSAQIFVLPLLLYYFKNLSLVSLPANIVILPTIPISMLLGFVSGLAGIFVPFLGQFVGYFVWLLTAAQLGIIKIFAKPSWAAVAVDFNWPMLIAGYCVLLLVLRGLIKKKMNCGSSK